MTAPLFFVAAGSLDEAGPGQIVRLAGDEGHHAVAALRVRAGEHVYLSDGVGARALAEVVEAHRAVLVTRVVTVDDEPAPDPRLVLVQALAKGNRDEQAIETATELGVDVVVPWQATRSVVQWRGERVERGRQRWAAIAVAAAKQSRRFRVPQVLGLVDRRGVAGLLADSALALVLDESAGMPLAAVPLPETGSVVLVVGPEGGLSDGDRAAFADAGGLFVRLGREVLRTSSAGPAALAVLSAAGRWR